MPPPAALAASLPSAILKTVLLRLAVLFLSGTGGNLIEARHAASQMLAAYHPETEDELRLAAEIISFSLHALEALSQAADPEMSLNQKLRLRGSAVSLSRESHKCQRRLDQLQKARLTGIPAEPANAASAPVPEPAKPTVEKALDLIEATRDAIASAGKTGRPTWTQLYRQRQTARRITENLKKNQAIAASTQAAAPAL
jgi:hypothetical protein